MVTKRATEIHLFRKALGQLNRGRNSRRAAFRTSMNGHAKQKKLPAQSNAKTNAPRKWIHVSTVARFLGASVGPSNPWRIITTATRNRGTCRIVRECRQRKNPPMIGTRSRSKLGASTDKTSGLEDCVPNELRSPVYFEVLSAGRRFRRSPALYEI